MADVNHRFIKAQSGLPVRGAESFTPQILAVFHLWVTLTVEALRARATLTSALEDERCVQRVWLRVWDWL